MSDPRHRLRRTRVLRVDPVAPGPSVIAEAAAVLRSGGLVVFPTETVYGLGANALDEAAVVSIFSAKERSRDDPLIVHIAGRSDLPQVARDVPPLAARLAESFWPGPLTIVVPRGPAVAPSVSAGLGTVAVRAPRNPVALALIRASGVPIAAPSANRFMRTSATSAEHVLEDLDGRVDLVLDGGPSEAGIESTVVAVDGLVVRLLRKGAVSAEELLAVLDDVPGSGLEMVARGSGSGSPGTMERHYAPRKPLTLVTISGPAGLVALQSLVARAAADGEIPGVLAVTDEAAGFGATSGVEVADLGEAADDQTVARRLFAAMRSLDRSRATALFARTVPETGRGAAVNDRLRRAAARTVSEP